LLRTILLSGAALVSAGIAWADWKLGQRKKLISGSSTPKVEMSFDPNAGTHQANLSPVVQQPTPNELPQQPTLDPFVEQAIRQAVLFRQHVPPRHDVTHLSFWGGRPIASSSFVWPTWRNEAHAESALTFLMQINCADVPEQARLGVFPDSGVLYFFLNPLGHHEAYRVILESTAGPLSEIAIPQTLQSAYASEAKWMFPWILDEENLPKLLPKWTFQPVAIEIPREPFVPDEDDDGSAQLLWPGERGTMQKLLLEAQGEIVVSDSFSVGEIFKTDGVVMRPYSQFPQDWNCVQISAALLAEKVRRDQLRGTTEEMDLLAAEANEWINLACQQNPFEVVPEPEAQRFWDWIAKHARSSRFVLTDALPQSIEASLSHSEQSAKRIPPEAIDRIRGRHAFARMYKSEPFIVTPDRMLAPPRDIQGNQYERAISHILLLEVSSDEGIAHYFGEGVYQFWITPEDLKKRRFENVVLTADAY
jgi:hypothetical protein